MRFRALGFLGVSAIVLTASVAATFGQAPSSPRFDLASIRANTSGNAGRFFGFQGGQFRATNLPLRTLITVAYGDLHTFPNSLIPLIGEPNWLGSDRFDVIARVEGDFPATGPPIAQQQLLLRSLLAERFNLIAHSETRELPIYELVLARADGKLGPQLRESEVDCVALRASQRDGGTLPSPPPPFIPGSPLPMCDLLGGFGRISGSATSIDQAAALLTRMLNVNRPVVNKTTLAGNYDLDLRFTPDTPAPTAGSPQLPRGFDPNGPSIYTAIQEQLGLKLEPSKGPVAVLVIDHVEHPTEN